MKTEGNVTIGHAGEPQLSLRRKTFLRTWYVLRCLCPEVFRVWHNSRFAYDMCDIRLERLTQNLQLANLQLAPTHMRHHAQTACLMFSSLVGLVQPYAVGC